MTKPDDYLWPDGLKAEWTSVIFNLEVTDRVIRDVRHRVMNLASRLPFSEPDLCSIETAIGEAACNAVRHGSPKGAQNSLLVHCQSDEDQFSVEITDQGAGFTPHLIPLPVAEEMNSSGYGLFLMRGLMDQVEYSTPPEGGTTIKLIKRYSHEKDPRLR